MGSTGTGNFTDYPSSGGKHQKESNKCERAFTTGLEDVELNSYFEKNKTVPNAGVPVEIVLIERIVAISTDGLIFGNLPSSYNYLKVCMDQGYTYSGVISASSSSPLSVIDIAVTPS